MSHKTFVIISCVITLVIVAGTGFANYLVDPLLQYRSPANREWYKKKFQRQVNPGRVRNIDCDTIVIGSSMAENFRQSEIDRFFGGKSLNLSVSGMRAFEARIMLEYALGQRKVSRAIISIDHGTFGPLKDLAERERNFPREYYDSSLLNDYRYLLNFEMLKYSAYQISGLKAGAVYRDRDAPWFWGDKKRQSREAVLVDWAKFRHQCGDSAVASVVLDTMAGLFARNILEVTEQHPSTRFELFFPPYSVMKWLSIAECGHLDMAMAFRSRVVAMCTAHSNVRVHDFQADTKTTSDLDHYKDMVHFGPEISSEMLRRMAAGDRVVDSDTVEEKNGSIRKQLQELDVAAMEMEVAAIRPQGNSELPLIGLP